MINNILPAFRIVFNKPFYILLGLVIAIMFFLGAILLPGISFLKFSFLYAPPEFWVRFKILFKVWGFFKMNSTLWSQWLVFLVSILAGINFSMLIFYLKRKIKLERSVGTGFVGIIIGIFGVGCASCGSVVLSSIFGYTAVTNFLGILPFHGIEIGVLGLMLLLLSIYLLASKIQNPAVCKI
ncbi:MAG: hypothetical protein HOC78_01785 [Candidatus Komeilibacteria bacterium]|nr:hypothetical protein [Candidatus Komeilibacteria bacterium]